MNDIDLLRVVGATVALPDEETRAGALERLSEAIEAEGQGSLSRRRPTPARRVMRRWRILVPALAVFVSAFVVLLLVLPLERQTSAAAAVLADLSEIARGRRALVPQPGEYVYTRSVGVALQTVETLPDGEEVSTLDPSEREAWVGTDGSGRIIDDGVSTSYGPGELSRRDEIAALPSDPGELREMIERGEVMHGSGEPGSTFDIVGNLLRENFVSPELRAALFQVAADIPGIELLEETTDRLGRPGVGVALTDRGIRHVLIFDPDTSALLGQEEIVADPEAMMSPGTEEGAPGLEVGDVLLSEAYSEPIIVESTQERSR